MVNDFHLFSVIFLIQIKIKSKKQEIFLIGIHILKLYVFILATTTLKSELELLNPNILNRIIA